MGIWAIFACLLITLAAGSPLREPNEYNYDVKHPGGSSRVRVRSGSDTRNRNREYVSDESYVNPHFVAPPYQQNRYGHYQGGYDQQPYQRHAQVPVYVERSRYPQPAGALQRPYDHFSTYERNPYGTYPEKRAISQSAVDAGPFYEKSVDRIPVVPSYSNPHLVQQVSVDDATLSYPPRKLEQVSFDPKPSYEQVVPYKQPVKKVVLVPSEPVVVQQVASDDFPGPNDYSDRHTSQYPLINDNFRPASYLKSPFDQQVLVDEPEKIPSISQKPLDDKLSQVVVDVPSTKSVPVIAQVPIVQQSSLDDIPPSSIVQYMDDGKIAQISVDDKPPPIQQQVSIDDADYVSKKTPYPGGAKSDLIQQSINPDSDDVIIGKSYGSPVIQTPIDEHPSQAVYDSSIEPSFSDIDHPLPVSVAEQPKYHFIPTGPPYEKFSHSTEIIHGPHYSQAVPPQKHIETKFPVVQDSPVRHSVKLPPPPPPPITKSFVPVGLPSAQEHVDADILLEKDPPVLYQSVKLPPPFPVTKSIVPAELHQAQEYVDSDILLTKNPPPPLVSQSVKLPPPPPVSQSIKLPPPPPVTKSVAPETLAQVQEPVDIVLTKNPPKPQSFKLPPPPPPITKSIVSKELPYVQQHVDADTVLTKDPFVPHSVKLPPPPPVSQSVKLPPPPPVSKSIKLPPPPPVTKSVVQTPLSQVQEPVDIVLTKNPPPPAYIPAYKTPVAKPPPSIKRPFYGYKSPSPSRVKLPPPPPRWSKPYNIHFTKSHLPPISVKRPYATAPVYITPQLRYENPYPRIKVPVRKTSPVSHRVKLPPISNTHSVKHPKAAVVVAKSPPRIKTPPLAQASIKGYAPEKSSNSHSIKKPYPAVGAPYSKTNVGNPQLQQTSYDAPPKKYLPITHVAEQSYPAHEDELDSHVPPPDAPAFEEYEEKSPFDKYPPVSHSVRLPSAGPPKPDSPIVLDLGDKSSIADITGSSPLDKYPRISHAVRLPGVAIPATTSVPNLFAAVPLSDPHDVTGAGLLDQHSPSSEPHISAPRPETLSSPLSHSVRLNIPGLPRSSRRVDASFDEPSKQEFPAFPVESALKQQDPVSEKVAELTNSFSPGTGYLESRHDLEEDDESPKSQSVDDAKKEINRINREIGFTFGDRIPRRRSRFS